MASLLPPTLDAQTVPNLITTLDLAFYPPPSAGFTARIGVLWALTGLYVLLAFHYLWLHYQSSTERPRRRSLWLARLVDRPGGRFIVLNPRPIWTLTVVFYGFYELLFLGSFWRVYKLGRPQHAWMGIRSFNGVALFVGGWVISWSGLQAFLLAVETEQPYLSAGMANALFLGGGTFLVLLHVALAIATTIVSNRLFDRYVDLRGALVALQQSLNGRVPTLIDFIPVQRPAEAFAAAGAAARAPNVVMWSLTTLLAVAVIAVDLGGLALARKLRRQIRESVELLVHADAGSSGFAHATGETSGAAPAISVQIPFTGSAAAHNARKPSLTPSDASSGLRDKRKSSMTNSEVRNLALQRREGGGAAAARAQAKKVLALQKATRDLQAVTGNIAFISTCLLGMAIWVAYCSGMDKTTNGQWDIEGTALPAQWLYTVAVTISLSYLTYNAVLNRRRLVASDEGTCAAPAPGQGGPARRSLICNFAEAGSVERSVALPEPLREEDEDRAGGEAMELAPAGTGSPPKDPLGEEEGALYPPPPLPRVLDGARTPQGRKSWTSLRSEHSGKSSAAKKLGWLPGRGRGSRCAGARGAGPAIMVTVETAQVCDGETSPTWEGERDEEESWEWERTARECL
ncbi:hypothetical protein JCM10449v2_000059 [Rhodotorula kratochvilovae]